MVDKTSTERLDEINNGYYNDGGFAGVDWVLSKVQITPEMIAWVRCSAVGREHMPNHARLLTEIIAELERREHPNPKHVLIGLVK